MPCAENGWRSQLDLVCDSGPVLRTEIVTAFARRSGPSNRDLEPARLDERFQAHRAGERARRTSLIRRMGSADRNRAEADTAPPHRVLTIDRDEHLNGVGLVYFANIRSMIADAEHNAIPNMVGVWPMRDRRVHYFGNLDVGDQIEITSHATAKSLSPHASILLRSHAKRASDGAVIAVAESIYGN